MVCVRDRILNLQACKKKGEPANKAHRPVQQQPASRRSILSLLVHGTSFPSLVQSNARAERGLA